MARHDAPRCSLKIVGVPTDSVLTPAPNTNIPEAFEAKLKNIKGSGTCIPIRIRIPGSSIHIKSTGLPQPGQCLSYITRRERKMAFTRHYPSIRAARVLLLSGIKRSKEMAVECAYSRGRKGVCSAFWCKVALHPGSLCFAVRTNAGRKCRLSTCVSINLAFKGERILANNESSDSSKFFEGLKKYYRLFRGIVTMEKTASHPLYISYYMRMDRSLLQRREDREILWMIRPI